MVLKEAPAAPEKHECIEPDKKLSRGSNTKNVATIIEYKNVDNISKPENRLSWCLPFLLAPHEWYSKSIFHSLIYYQCPFLCV